MSLERSLLAAQGYIELDMPDEALRELDALPPAHRDDREARQMRLFVFIRAEQWEKALEMCQILREAYPDSTTAYIHGAFCLHELKRTREAREFLLSGPASLQDEPTYHYNLACYDAVLGNLEEARQHLHISFKLDKNFRKLAKDDPDLKAVHDMI